MYIHGFDWDQGNWPKCGRHGVKKNEIEALFKTGPAVSPTHGGVHGEIRQLAIGRTPTGRWLFVAFTFRRRRRGRRRLIRPISARYMHPKEVEHYEKQKSA